MTILPNRHARRAEPTPTRSAPVAQHQLQLKVSTALLLVAAACTSSNSANVEGAGGLLTIGGTSAISTNAVGGAITQSTGGASAADSGGQQTSGGSISTPGTRTTGGVLSTGGAIASGGTTTNHATRTGGATGAAGHPNQGGSPSSGGITERGASSTAGGARATGGSVASGGVMTGGATGSLNAAGRSNAGSAAITGGSTAGGGSASNAGPCDIFKAGSTPCVAAHSTVRALFSSYSGKLYQVRRADNATKEISTLTVGGYADGPAQDAFCAGSTCVTTVVYDQSGNGNDLWYQGSTAVPGSPQSSPAKADTEPLTVSGHKVYSLYIKPGNSYWRDGSKSSIPIKTEPEGMYMVTSGKHVNAGCCFDYGNSETTRTADAAGAMDAINFGKQCWFGGCSGSGPWVQADLEWGLFPGGSQTWNPSQQAFANAYVTAMLKNNGTTEFALKGGNAQSGALTTLYKGKLPSGYNPMKKQGAIVLGSGGDCCNPSGGANLSEGTFYEGAIVSGYPADATDDAIQSNIVAAGY